MQTWNNRYHSVGFSNTMSKQLEAENETFRILRVYVWSIQKYKFCLSVTLIGGSATLLLKSACHFFGGKIARNGQYGLDICL